MSNTLYLAICAYKCVWRVLLFLDDKVEAKLMKYLIAKYMYMSRMLMNWMLA